MKRFSTILLILMISSILVPSNHLGINSGEVVCCDAIKYDLLFSGTSNNGQLSPFESTLDVQQSAEVTSAITQTQEVARWSGQTGFAGEFPSHTAIFSLPYKINDGAGVTINASIELRLGSESNIGSTSLPQTFLPGDSGTLEVNIDVSGGTLTAGDTILVIFTVQELLLPTGANPSIDFLWGTDSYRGYISVEAPLFSVDINEPLIEGRSVHIPVKFDSGYGAQLIAESNFEFNAGGNLIQQLPVSTEGNILTWTWNAENGVDDGTYSFEIRINFQNGTEISATTEFDIEFGDTQGNNYFYPLSEPIRTGGTDLDVLVEVEMSNDIEKTITLELKENVAFWIRWGLDNMGNPSLNSTSWLNNLNPANSDYYQNRIVDNAEISNFEQQIRQNELSNFLAQGLGIDSRRLLGLERADFDYVGIDILLNGDDTVSNTPVNVVFKTRETSTAANEHLMIDNFIKPYFDDNDRIWTTVNLKFELKTDAINGVFLSDATGIDVTQTRLIFTEKIVATTSFTQSDSPLLWVQQGGNPVESPIAIFIISLGIALIGLIISGVISRGKNKIILVSEVIILFSVGFLLYFLSLEFIVVFGSSFLSSGLWILTALMTGSKNNLYSNLDDENITSFNCPNCTTELKISSNERPIRIKCEGCKKVLKIVD
ncbi:MAG: hypothetical protein CMB56_000740 [Methanobacteriota archaeon]|nr:MAG: hypothetical protein CMB56_000740 [Euryarchaeota archaeon]